ncbi:MAG: hypothetical protein ACREBU_04380 [Nitrososphaera sp.]
MVRRFINNEQEHQTVANSQDEERALWGSEVEEAAASLKLVVRDGLGSKSLSILLHRITTLEQAARLAPSAPTSPCACWVHPSELDIAQQNGLSAALLFSDERPETVPLFRRVASPPAAAQGGVRGWEWGYFSDGHAVNRVQQVRPDPSWRGQCGFYEHPLYARPQGGDAELMKPPPPTRPEVEELRARHADLMRNERAYDLGGCKGRPVDWRFWSADALSLLDRHSNRGRIRQIATGCCARPSRSSKENT